MFCRPFLFLVILPFGIKQKQGIVHNHIAWNTKVTYSSKFGTARAGAEKDEIVLVSTFLHGACKINNDLLKWSNERNTMQ